MKRNCSGINKNIIFLFFITFQIHFAHSQNDTCKIGYLYKYPNPFISSSNSALYNCVNPINIDSIKKNHPDLDSTFFNVILKWRKDYLAIDTNCQRKSSESHKLYNKLYLYSTSKCYKLDEIIFLLGIPDDVSISILHEICLSYFVFDCCSTCIQKKKVVSSLVFKFNLVGEPLDIAWYP
jgi:hypothetical protein